MVSNGLKQWFNYDEKDRLVDSFTSINNANQYKTSYMYGDTAQNQKEEMIYGLKLNDVQKIGYAYDSKSRLTEKSLANNLAYKVNYTYANNAEATISSLKNGNNQALNYTYDNVGNITTISEGTELKVSYTYDDLYQLTREDNAELNKTITYTYDNGGNITAKKEYAYTTGALGTSVKTIPYVYGDTNWKDKLTVYNGQNLSYDSIGNPLTYRDGFNFTWSYGRSLRTINKTGLSAVYNYNDSGIRTSKTVNGVTTNYFLDGDKIIRQSNPNYTLDFFYDDKGDAYGFDRIATNGHTEHYYYVRNAQNDIIEILNEYGDSVCKYTYDTWGNVISITGIYAETL